MHVMRADGGIVKVALDEIIRMEDVNYVAIFFAHHAYS